MRETYKTKTKELVLDKVKKLNSFTANDIFKSLNDDYKNDFKWCDYFYQDHIELNDDDYKKLYDDTVELFNNYFQNNTIQLGKRKVYVVDFGDSWVIDRKYEITKDYGIVYYYSEYINRRYRDFPQWVFKLRDLLMKQERKGV